VLGQYKSRDYLKETLGLIESMSEAYLGTLGGTVGNLAKIGNSLASALQNITKSNDIEPIIAQVNNLNPLAEPIVPGFYVLINCDETKLVRSNFFVKDYRLYCQDEGGKKVPYRDNDYVLYSILATDRRENLESLPFYSDFTTLKTSFKDIAVMDDEQKKVISAKLFALYSRVRTSPDLTNTQMGPLNQYFKSEIIKMIDERTTLQIADKHELSESAKNELREALEFLNLKN
jgi:hypothetical protein